jgi:hypothetical protein
MLAARLPSVLYLIEAHRDKWSPAACAPDPREVGHHLAAVP